MKQAKRRIWITGGSSGIGLQLAKDFLAEGCDVAIFAHAGVAEALSTLTTTSSAEVEGYSMDVTNGRSVSDAFTAAATSASPDWLINCAGVLEAAPFQELTENAFRKQIEVNLIGSRNVAAEFLQVLKAKREDVGEQTSSLVKAKKSQRPRIIFIASMGGLIGCYGYSGYSASKFGVVGLAHVLRMELEPKGIDVCVVCPPEVETPMVEQERQHGPPLTAKMKGTIGRLSVEEASRLIRKGLKGGRFMVIPGTRARWAERLNRWMPWASTWITDRTIRLNQGPNLENDSD